MTIPYGRIYFRMAEAFGWGPEIVGELTLDQVIVYMTEGTAATTAKLGPSEAAEHFRQIEAERAG